MIPPRWLDLLYPPACHLCAEPLRDGQYLCPACRDALPRVVPPLCAGCGLPLDGRVAEGTRCPGCRAQRFAFAFARSAARARDGGRELVHAFKYRRQVHLRAPLGDLLAEVFADPRVAGLDGAVLVPVPLHWRRARWRWFNQADELARVLGRRRGLPVVRALRRVRSTRQQIALSRRDRLANLRGAFRIRRRGMLADRAVLLVDDVFTTGATAHACAEVLRHEGGAQKVVVLTVLRG